MEAVSGSLLAHATAPVMEPPTALRVKLSPYWTFPGLFVIDSGLCPAARMVNVFFASVKV